MVFIMASSLKKMFNKIPDSNKYRVSIWNNENVLEMDGGDELHNNTNVLNATEQYVQLKMIKMGISLVFQWPSSTTPNAGAQVKEQDPTCHKTHVCSHINI